jgi:ABC-2 type transport system permease protein
MLNKELLKMLPTNRHAGFLLRANLKQNKRFILVWLLILIIMIASGATKFQTLFETGGHGVKSLIQTLKMPGMAGIFGAVPTDLTKYDPATVFSSTMIVFMVVLGALFTIPLAVRDTRGQEENGLLEMIRARNVGRTASVTAAILELILVNLVLGSFYFFGLIMADLDGANLTGNLLLSVALIAANLMFGALALLMAQLTSTAHGASMLSYTVLAIAYLLRMVTDVKDPDYTWLSPIGWVQKINAYTDNNYWPVALILGVAIILALLAMMIGKTRDLGTGIIPESEGRAKASGWLCSIPALLIRTERNAIVGWLLGSVVFGAVFGSIFGSVGDILKMNPVYRQFLSVDQVNAANRTMVLSFMAMFLLVFVALAVTAGVQLIFRLKRDETQGYLEIIHAEKLVRIRISLSFYLFGLIFAAFVFSAAILSTFFTGNAVLKEPLAYKYLWRMLIAGLPAVWAFITLAIAIVGAVPKLTGFFWTYLGIGLVIKMFAPLLDLPKRTANFSPFGWVDRVPIHAIETHWLIIMALGGLCLLVVGIVGYNQRDLE